MLNEVAAAIDRNFTSPNVEDMNFENANVVDALDKVGRALWCLSRRTEGNKDLGAVEYLAVETHAGLTEVATALNRIADALEKKS